MLVKKVFSLSVLFLILVQNMSYASNFYSSGISLSKFQSDREVVIRNLPIVSSNGFFIENSVSEITKNIYIRLIYFKV